MATAASLPSCEPRTGACARARRVLVVHRFPVIRFGVMKLVEEHLPDIVTAGTGAVSQALRLVRASNWDLVVMGLSFDGRSGLDLRIIRGKRALVRQPSRPRAMLPPLEVALRPTPGLLARRSDRIDSDRTVHGCSDV